MTAAEQRAEAILKRLPKENPKACEIGVFTGQLSRILLRERQDLTLYMIDAWSDISSEEYKATKDYHAKLSLEQQEHFYNLTRGCVAKYGDRGKIVRKFSSEAVNGFPDQYFDLVFIDADHSYEGCKKDIEAYHSKVKKGGYLGGHDYENYENDLKFGVTQAVDEYIKENNKELELDLNYTWFTRLS